MKDQFVMISCNELKDLIEKSIAFEALCEWGVDNWQHYGEVDWDQVDEVVAFELEKYGM